MVEITAEFLWVNHRASLGGVSGVTGAPLPELLKMCPMKVQGAHWGMACAVSRALGQPDPPAPPLLTAEEQREILTSLSVAFAG